MEANNGFISVMKQTHHIIPKYKCKELGIDPEFPENLIEVEREDHALIHWGYWCDDLEPLFEYIIPLQWVIDLIPRGDNRDVGGAVLTARGEIDEIVPLFGKDHPSYIHGKLTGVRKDGMWNPKIRAKYDAYIKPLYWKNLSEERRESIRAYQRTPEYLRLKRIRDRKSRARKKAERQRVGTL